MAATNTPKAAGKEVMAHTGAYSQYTHIPCSIQVEMTEEIREWVNELQETNHDLPEFEEKKIITHPGAEMCLGAWRNNIRDELNLFTWVMEMDKIRVDAYNSDGKRAFGDIIYSRKESMTSEELCKKLEECEAVRVEFSAWLAIDVKPKREATE